MNEKLELALATFVHVAYLFFGIGFILVPAIIYLFFGDKSAYVKFHAKQALKVQVALTLSMAILIIASFLIIPIILWPLFLFAVIVYIPISIYAAYKAFNYEDYRYPFM